MLWCNVRDAFGTEISQMYRTLRSNGVLSYDVVQQRFANHQAKWPEAVFNEDAWVKYIGPLINPAAGKTPTASYLEMAQGSKAEQRKWWLYNRFRYMDSKWTAGDARNNIIELRGYAKANITVTPYSDIYPAVRYASYTVTERGTHGVPTTLVCPIDTLNDSEIWIFSAPQLASVGDLSPLKVGRADFRAATNLQDIRVGSNATGYTNPNLTQLYVGNNSLLRTIDARNCTALAGALDFSGASNVEHVYLDGTAVTSVSLPVGGIMKTLSLPDTITNLTVQSQPGITSFSMEGSDYSSITTLRVENSGSAIPVLDILSQMSAGSRVRILGFVALADTTQDVEDFFDFLDTMAGMTEAGINVDKPVVQGTITGLGTITGAWLAEMNERYPDVAIQYEHISSALSYYSWDGLTLLHTETVTDGGNGTWDGTPTRTSTAQYSYTFAGWSRYTDQSTADPTATQGVGADRSVYAAYTATTRTYTVTWKNADNTTLETDQNVPYGTTPTYNGATPTYQGETSTGWNPAVGPVTGDTTYTAIYIPTYQVRFYSGTTLLDTVSVQQGNTATYTGATPVKTGVDNPNDYTFNGWSPSNTNIQANTDCYAQFNFIGVPETITDSWDEIIASTNNGTYSTKYSIGDTKKLDLGTEGMVSMQLVAFDADDKADGTGKVATTWVSVQLLATSCRMNPAREADPEDSTKYKVGTGGIGGWEHSEMRTYLAETILPMLPANVRTAIKPVKKASSYVNTSGTRSGTTETIDSLWLASNHEVFGSTTYETTGPVYSGVFTDAESRKKYKAGETSASFWWTRSASSSLNFRYVNNIGSDVAVGATSTYDVCLGFCI